MFKVYTDMHQSNLVSNIVHLSHAIIYLSKAKDVVGLILSLDCVEIEQIQKFQLAKGNRDKFREPKGSFTG